MKILGEVRQDLIYVIPMERQMLLQKQEDLFYLPIPWGMKERQLEGVENMS